MDFFRSEAYMEFFEYLDATGGFFYEVRHGLSYMSRIKDQ